MKKAVLQSLIVTGAMVSCASAYADEASVLEYFSVTNSFSQVELEKDYALGIGRFDLDSHTEIIGWQINNSWYFGRQDGLDSGLTLVWQSSANQVSLSKDGLRLTRRF